MRQRDSGDDVTECTVASPLETRVVCVYGSVGIGDEMGQTRHAVSEEAARTLPGRTLPSKIELRH
jgi:hypothetical protein